MRLNEVYKNSGLGKWFHKETANKTPGWDRYNSAGKRVGECGDAKKGEPYSACLSKQKAEKLGKEGIANFVKRKRAAQTKAGRGTKGSETKGKKPIYVSTGASKRKVNEQMEPSNKECGCEHEKPKTLFSKIKEKMLKKVLNEDAPLGKPFRTPDGPKKFAVRVKNEKGNVVTVSFGDPNMEIKRDDPNRRKNFRARHGCDTNPGPRTKARYWSCRMWEKGKSVSQLTKEAADFTNLDLTDFIGKKVLIETFSSSDYGTLGTFKTNYVLLENEQIKKAIDPTEIVKVICEDNKILILEKNKPNDPEKWSDCKSQAKKKFDVYPSAYANAWAAKCYKQKGGSWRKVNEEVQQLNEVIKHRDGKWVVMNKEETKVLGTHPSKTKALAQLRAIEASKARHGMNENTDFILAEKLKDRFFGLVNEDIVNPDNKGKLTPQKSNPRAISRDKTREKVKNKAKVVTGPKDKNGRKLRDDTPEEASYRLATYIELKKDQSKGEKSIKNKASKSKNAKKKTNK